MPTISPAQPHLAFISPYCALDLKSGASQSVRTILHAMTSIGWKASSFTGNCQDTPSGLPNSVTENLKKKSLLIAQDKLIQHHIYKLSGYQRGAITANEENRFYLQCCQFLDKIKPTHILTFGGLLSERMLAMEARQRSIQTAFYLVNPNYQGATGFFNLFDFVLTDSSSTVNLYKNEIPLIHNIGQFIEPEKIAAKRDISQKKWVTFINPSPEKGVEVVLKIIQQMDDDKDIHFLIVESRGTWNRMVREYGFNIESFKDRVRVIPFQQNMSNIYAQTKLLLIPSLWHESGPRVAGEAVLNDIPVIGFNSGGIPEMIGRSGFIFSKPTVSRETRYKLPDNFEVLEWAEKIRELMTDSNSYEKQISLIDQEKNRYDLKLRAKNLASIIHSPSQ